VKKGHVPIRQCAGCKSRREKAVLLRFVHAAAGDWEADPRNRLPGRGVYLCSQACIQRLKKNKRYRTLSTTAETIATSVWPTISSI